MDLPLRHWAESPSRGWQSQRSDLGLWAAGQVPPHVLAWHPPAMHGDPRRDTWASGLTFPVRPWI